MDGCTALLSRAGRFGQTDRRTMTEGTRGVCGLSQVWGLSVVRAGGGEVKENLGDDDHSFARSGARAAHDGQPAGAPRVSGAGCSASYARAVYAPGSRAAAGSKHTARASALC